MKERLGPQLSELRRDVLAQVGVLCSYLLDQLDTTVYQRYDIAEVTAPEEVAPAAKDSRIERHRIEHGVPLRVPKPASHAALLVMTEAVLTQANLEGSVVATSDHLDDHVDVVGGTDLGRRWIRDPELDGSPAYENNLVAEFAQGVSRAFQQLEIHDVGAAGNNRSFSTSAASPRSRASPIRIASTNARLSASRSSRSAASGTDG